MSSSLVTPAELPRKVPLEVVDADVDVSRCVIEEHVHVLNPAPAAGRHNPRQRESKWSLRDSGPKCATVDCRCKSRHSDAAVRPRFLVIRVIVLVSLSTGGGTRRAAPASAINSISPLLQPAPPSACARELARPARRGRPSACRRQRRPGTGQRFGFCSARHAATQADLRTLLADPPAMGATERQDSAVGKAQV
jgi:hypothetical protein